MDGSKGFGAALKSPVVIIGGVGLGLVLLMMAKNSAPTNNSGTVVPGYNSTTSAYNMAALDAQTSQASIWAQITAKQIGSETDIMKARIGAGRDIEIAQAGANVNRYISTMSFLENMGNNVAQVSRQNIVSRSGVTQSMIQANAAVTQDQIVNNARLSLGNVDAGVQMYKSKNDTYQAIQTSKTNAEAQIAISNNNVLIAKAQAKAVKSSAKSKMFGDIVGTIGKVAALAL